MTDQSPFNNGGYIGVDPYYQTDPDILALDPEDGGVDENQGELDYEYATPLSAGEEGPGVPGSTNPPVAQDPPGDDQSEVTSPAKVNDPAQDDTKVAGGPAVPPTPKKK